MTLDTVLPTGARAGALGRITGDERAFLERTWGHRAAVFRSGSAPVFEGLLSFDDVDRILSTMSLRTPMFRLVKAGTPIPEASYTRTGRTGSRPVTGIADPAKIFGWFRDGATIVLQGLHRYWEPVAVLTRELEVELGHPCQVNAYVTPPGARGLELHSDPHDVFVLQTFGSKDWEVHAAPREAARRPIEAVLSAGDAAYLPTGTPHAAATQETLSGHLTVGVNLTSWREVLADAWRLVEHDAALDEPIPAGWTRDADGFADALRRRLAATGDRIASADASAIARARVERLLSTRAPLVRGVLSEEPLLALLDDTSGLRRRPGSVCELRSRGEELIVLLGDRRIVMPAWLEPAMREIASRERLEVGELREAIADPASRAVLARRLVREGLLTVER